MSPRAALLAAAKAAHAEGLVVGTTGNLALRTAPDRFLVTPTARPYPTMTEDDLVLMTVSGDILEGDRAPSSEWRVHAEVFRNRPEFEALVHVHPAAAQAWSLLGGERLDTRTEELEAYAGGPVRVAPFSPTGGEELAILVAEAIEGRNAALMARHGLLAGGPTLDRALDVARIVERQAQVALLVRSATLRP